jgi:hypothetical protein
MSVETIRNLSPAPDGATTIFETPSRYKAGTLRVVWNGQVYEASDTIWGWTELNDLAIQMVTPPRTGDCLQAFYTDLDLTGSENLTAIGRPFSPSEYC